MIYQEKCSHCGNVLTAYSQPISLNVISAFVSFVELFLKTHRPVNTSTELNLTHNQICNLQKLRYYGLMKMADGNGMWVPTEKGIRFYYGEESVKYPVLSLNNETLPDHHEAYARKGTKRTDRFINSFLNTHYKTRPEYKEEASSAPRLF